MVKGLFTNVNLNSKILDVRFNPCILVETDCLDLLTNISFITNWSS